MADERSESTVATGAFAEMGLIPPLLEAVGRMGWTAPTEIQAKMIPPALAGRDILGQAKTGTGKTAGFALPILHRLGEAEGKPKAGPVRCLILAPTRELAAQVADDVQRLARFTPHRLTIAYGGTRVAGNAEQLRRRPAIVVGTPGRVMDLMQRKLLHLDKLDFAVLDEVDRMLDIGFREDIRRILGAVHRPHQTIFVSATISEEINRLARQYMNDPLEIFCAGDRLTVDEVEQHYVTAMPEEKVRMLVQLIREEAPEHALVFTRTRRATTRVARDLHSAGINAREIHGELYQRKRDRIMESFRSGKLHVLVATDLASRGLDIDDISHVINYDIPEDPEVYVHRVGRTARMGRHGKAFTFVTPEQGEELTRIEMLINCEISCHKLEGFRHMAAAPAKPTAGPVVAKKRPGPGRGGFGRRRRRR
ncbi:MAG TPA: DEAD/DEAH box helicase [Phycisphaerae bacterium]|nr:DEAD/DEAH box helicase [Phycisphaerae bacterium]